MNKRKTVKKNLSPRSPPPGKIYNPATKRFVNIDGEIGKRLLGIKKSPKGSPVRGSPKRSPVRGSPKRSPVRGSPKRSPKQSMSPMRVSPTEIPQVPMNEFSIMTNGIGKMLNKENCKGVMCKKFNNLVISDIDSSIKITIPVMKKFIESNKLYNYYETLIKPYYIGKASTYMIDFTDRIIYFYDNMKCIVNVEKIKNNLILTLTYRKSI
jgi:hypothetical protein